MADLSWIAAAPIAHRGLHDRAAGVIENSLSAATRAIERGFPIECDLQLSADGQAMVFHDFTLDRLTGETGDLTHQDSRSLARIGLTGSGGDTIPTLGAFLAHVGGRVPLVVEIKSRFDGDMALARRACEVLSGYGGPFAVKSFDPDVVAQVRRIAPGFARGIVAEGHYDHPSYDSLPPERKHALSNLLHYEESRFQFVSWNVRDLPSAGPYLARAMGGMPVMAWTVRDAQARARAARHADQMVFEGFVP